MMEGGGDMCEDTVYILYTVYVLMNKSSILLYLFCRIVVSFSYINFVILPLRLGSEDFRQHHPVCGVCFLSCIFTCVFM